MTVVIYFIKRDGTDKYKKSLISVHLILLLLLTVDIFLINLKGVWLDRLLIVAFLFTASLTFALYRKTLRLWQKLYFGFYVFYPAFAAATFLIDRIMFAIVASPLIVSLTIPEVRFSSKDYDVRVPVGIIVPMRLQLIKKGLITEKSLGICNDDDVVALDISSISIAKETKDSTNAIITSNDKTYQATFIK
ncbi:hypothetical protein FC093_23400 [Ilyomonas limi]|uniref:Uncharacterized protein n=1 Tax=Ilyomonas limi TaxID=2575867 RepID=A0A4U3KT27_9BACT|nr:hypothetical protein [Ilyomonas limi]TKK64046.1 hypothetical protein FC093_23400 [Ilyomonas limi]